MQFKSPAKKDDTQKIRDDLSRDIRVGGKAHVSLGGMKSIVLKVMAVGKDGARCQDAKGRTYEVLFEHISGPADSDEEVDDTHKPSAQATHDEPLTKALPATQNQPHRALYAGDSIYFSDAAGQAQHGLVAAVGKHGATVDCQDDKGKTTSHQVRHSAIIGHRKRAERKLIVIDRGEDGSICADESGKRVFIRGDLGELKAQHQEQEMTKALAGDYQPADDARIIGVVNAALAPVLSAMAAMQQQHQQALDRFAGLVAGAIGKPLPAITLQLPDQPAPSVHVDVNVPEQAAPVFSPVIHVPEQPAPVVNVINPPRRTVSTIERDKDGNMTRAIQEDQPL